MTAFEVTRRIETGLSETGLNYSVATRGARKAPVASWILVATGWFGWMGIAHAFPLTDALNPSLVVPSADPVANTVVTDLTPYLGAPGPFSGVAAPGFTFTPRISGQTGYNSNVLSSPTSPRPDWVNYLSPGIAVVANTSRIEARLDYSPTLGIYARTPSQNFLGQNFTGNGQVTVLEGLAYVDLRGYAGVQPRNGAGFGGTSGLGGSGAGFNNSSSGLGLPLSQLSQQTSFSITPYLLHKFGDIGTLKIGYSLTESTSTPVNGFGAIPFFSTGSSGLSGNSHLVTNQEVIQFQSGEILGRVNDLFIINANQYSGSGVSNGGYQNFVSDRVGYALTRQVTVFGEIGVEDIHYNGIPPTRINDGTWLVGTQLTPTADSTMSIGYGHKYGIDSLEANGAYQITPRFRVALNYSTGIGNELSQLQNTVAVSDLNQQGGLVNALTGAPLFTSVGTAGSNNNLYRSKSLTGSATLALDRDILTLSVSQYDQTVLATAPGSPVGLNTGNSSSGYSARAGWTHELSSLLSSIADIYYGTQQNFNGTSGSQNSFSAHLTLQYQLTETLTISGQYGYYQRDSPVSALNFNQHLALIGFNKTF